ncbi:hypothetical protein AV530_005865 [Patagioenas fasciata monilis]|uniref:Uncharacterized protein n=1 Tax=Patagioenas fasciata monilis TaxID=372326 RepID=A0A1V4JMX3_PATFA|nr:hypothetical protein AV530_005865 [Patagioenas fasciata monilis]
MSEWIYSILETGYQLLVKTVPHLLCTFLLQEEPPLSCVDPRDCSSFLEGFAVYPPTICELKCPRKARA